jgi:VanZ family protein
MRKLVIHTGILLVLGGVLLYAAFANVDPSVRPYISGHLVHFIASFVMTFALVSVLSHDFVKFKYPYILSLVVLSSFAFMIEAIQGFIPYRVASVNDALMGVYGALLYVLIAKMVWFVRRPVKTRTVDE